MEAIKRSASFEFEIIQATKCNEEDARKALIQAKGDLLTAIDIIKSNKVLILGNGKSRKEPGVIKQINKWTGEIWACNEAYKDYKEFPHLDRIGTVHNDTAVSAINFKEKHNLDYNVYILNPMEDKKYKNKIKYFSTDKGWSTGNLMVLQAFKEDWNLVLPCYTQIEDYRGFLIRSVIFG